MKKIGFLLLTSVLTSCGVSDHLAKKCGSGVGCEFVFGSIDNDQNKQISDLKARDKQIQAQIDALFLGLAALNNSTLTLERKLFLVEQKIIALYDNDDALQTQIDLANSELAITVASLTSLSLQQQQVLTQMAALGQRITNAENVDASLISQLDNLRQSLAVLESANYQEQIDDLLVELSNLTLTVADSVTKVWDPCGDHAGNFDEVILQTNSGKFIAYFEVSGKRFLSVLSNGTYVTTDNQACRFNVSGDSISPAVEL